jgi:threonine/homoserine/homoserine lactone efflux protein
MDASVCLAEANKTLIESRSFILPIQTWLIYFGVIALLIITPGPSAILCLTHGIQHGKLRTIATVFGGTCASMILMAAGGALIAAQK